MSAKGRGTKPIANDAYPTPPWAVRRLLERLDDTVGVGGGHWLEPACGRGVLVDTIYKWGEEQDRPRLAPFWTTVDISPTSNAMHVVDFLRWEAPTPMANLVVEPYHVAITNPPFSLAFEFAKKMTAIARHSFLLTRLNILEAGKKSGRLTWLSQNTPDVYVLPDRPCFSHTLRCSDRKSDGRTYDCRGVPIAWDAPTPARIICGCPELRLTKHGAQQAPVELRTAGTDATGYCWLRWDSSLLPRSSGLITHLAETPKSERVDRVVER